MAASVSPVPICSADEALSALRRQADPVKAEGQRRYFKTGPGEYGEGDRFLGLTVPQVRVLARACVALPPDAVAALLESPWHEARLLALHVLVRQYQRGGTVDRRRIHALYLGHTARINNWDLVDSSAEHIVGAHPGDRRTRLRGLARSASVWERRIAMLATLHGIRHGQYDEAIRVAGWLVQDDHDLIHKAVGWMLREVGKRDQAAEVRFLDQHAARMPRTMLRYAIERFPEPLRQHYLTARDVATSATVAPGRPAARRVAGRRATTRQQRED